MFHNLALTKLIFNAKIINEKQKFDAHTLPILRVIPRERLIRELVLGWAGNLLFFEI